MNHFSEEQLTAYLKFIIGVTFCVTLLIMVSVSMYSVVFVTQPMSGMAPADKQFFLLLSDMSKYILGALATLLAIKGKDALPQFVPPNLSKPEPIVSEPVRKEPVIQPVSTAPVVVNGFNGKPAPVQPPHPEIE